MDVNKTAKNPFGGLTPPGPLRDQNDGKPAAGTLNGALLNTFGAGSASGDGYFKGFGKENAAVRVVFKGGASSKVDDLTSDDVLSGQQDPSDSTKWVGGKASSSDFTAEGTYAQYFPSFKSENPLVPHLGAGLTFRFHDYTIKADSASSSWIDLSGDVSLLASWKRNNFALTLINLGQSTGVAMEDECLVWNSKKSSWKVTLNTTYDTFYKKFAESNVGVECALPLGKTGRSGLYFRGGLCYTGSPFYIAGVGYAWDGLGVDVTNIYSRELKDGVLLSVTVPWNIFSKISGQNK